ncbi:MAG: alpha/beta hydrolase [Acidobacteria bacterium]|nr:alpha/beta hydrolase [Acidobacteriota bacterium]MYJ03499.1 alpha/beta hydrolase [Acidobacteriota bacterium]
MPSPPLTRRQLLRGAAAGIVGAAGASRAHAAAGVTTQRDAASPYADDVLPPGVRSRFVSNVNGIRMHVLEAGGRATARAGVLLLHGFPELAYSWRRLIPALAHAGYHVLAPDLRGYGRTASTDVRYDDDLRPFRMLNEVRDMLSLVSAFGYREIHLAGHDFGSLVASWCAIARPDVFRSVVLMSAPFGGTARLPFGTADGSPGREAADAPATDIDADLAALDPPRWHYRRFYATREANDDLWRAPQGVHDFLRAYYHMKSADWSGNQPEPLGEWSAAALARLPRYYVLNLGRGMAETVAEHMPSPAEIAACEWLPDDELRVYSAEYERTGFQGGLQWYRSVSSVSSIFGGGINADLQVFAGRTIDQPSLFIAGAHDWGIHQRPGALERMETQACTDLRGLHLLDGAGHWVQQEKSAEVNRLVLDFLRSL